MNKLSFSDFDKRARDGEALSVVFFGGSLTWGANASDPNLTSYRGQMMRYLRERYPLARFTFHDAAIGGTGSALGIFRVDRDVLSKKPDMVFLDFQANDGYNGDDRPTNCFYEAIVRRIVGAGVPVEQLYFGFKWSFVNRNPAELLRRAAYHKIAAAYGLAEGDHYERMWKAIDDGEITADVAWPFDQAHPDDCGYFYFFDAARIAFEAAVANGTTCHTAAAPVFGDMANVIRTVAADIALPAGWKNGLTRRVSMWYDGLASRWMDTVATCDIASSPAPSPLRFEFDGTFFGLFGEGDQDGLDFEVFVDGVREPAAPAENGRPAVMAWSGSTANRAAGNLFFWRTVRRVLPDAHHVVEIRPIIPAGATRGQLRIGSICTARHV